MDYTLLIAVFAPLAFGLLTLFLPRKVIALRVLLALAGMVIAFGAVMQHVQHHGISRQSVHVFNWINSLNLNFAFLADGLGVFFALLVSGIGALIVLYARGYFGPNADDLYRFYPTLGFFATAMMGVVLADYILLTLLFWELTSISSFLLIGWDRYDKHAVKLGMQAFFTTGMGGMTMFGGLLLFGITTDVWQWSTFLTGDWWQSAYAAMPWAELQSNPPYGLFLAIKNNPVLGAFFLIFFGAATKSAQFPFHYWLPGAMAAPTPVSAYLHSATMVKAGVFLTGRLFPVLGAAGVAGEIHTGLAIWPYLITLLGALTMLYAAIVAIQQHDLKRIFAYTTVSQLGLLMCMYGMGALSYVYKGSAALAIDFDITQIANHAFYKAPLFIAAGAIGHYVSRDITQLKGAFWKHPGICVTMLLAAWGLAALPGSISFQAKELFLYAIYHLTYDHPWMWVIMGMTVVTAICNVAICVRLFTTLLGLPGAMKPVASHDDHDHHHEHEHEHSVWAHLIWLPGLAIVSLQFVGGLAPGLWTHYIGALETNVHYEGFHGHVPTIAHAFAHPGIPLMMSGVAVVGGVLLGLSPLLRKAIVDVCDKIYPALYWLCVTGGGTAFRVVQTGNMRHYLLFVFGAFLIGFTGSVFADNAMFDPLHRAFAQITEFVPGMMLGVIICAAAIGLPLIASRIIRVLLLGACGFTVVAMYLVYQAPDLALTQLMFEIISVILFVLVLRLLPRDEVKKRPGRAWRLLLGAAVGIAFGWMTIVAADAQPMEKLGTFFAQSSYSCINGTRGGGGNNIVNVILVDFRGFDTLGEITVLALAAMGVWSFLPTRKKRKEVTA